LKTSQELASYDRLSRRVLGEKFLEKMIKADKVGHGHCLVMSKDSSSGIFFMSTTKEREDRVRGLYNLACSVYCIRDLRNLVAIATENLSVKLRSYDFIHLIGVNFENKEELIELGKKWFGPEQNKRFTEY
jgi:hypothetical protein